MNSSSPFKLIFVEVHDLSTFVKGPIVAGFLLLCYLILSWIYNVWFHPLRKYPGPLVESVSNVPIAWHMITGNQYHWTLKLHQKYGHVVRVAPNELSYISPDAWKDIYGVGSKLAGRKWKGFYDPRNPQLHTMQGANDEDHPKLRRIFSPAFSEKALRDQQPMLKQYTDALVVKLNEWVQEQPDKPIDISKMYNYTTFDIMGDLAFGESLHMIENMKYTPWVATQFESIKIGTLFIASNYLPITKPLLELFVWLNREAFGYRLKVAAEHVDRRLATKTAKPDIWSLALREDLERRLDLHEMHTHGLLFIVAGTETSATALSGLTYHLLTRPETYENLTEEIRNAFNSIDEMTLQSLAKLPYLHDCVEEGLRVYPPVPIGLPREVPPEGAVISGQWVPPNAVVYVSQLPAYMDSSNFRDPDQFIPERWSSPEYATDNKNVLRPFLVGARNCLGQSLAYHEIRLIIATVLFHFDLELQECSKDWTEQKVYAIWEKNPLMVRLKPRA
ncbi:cytochrome P450 [Zopfia rhizophila CBS 207.26]|uniref:Cytochrome P450 n=1 Tax=Zopfia rhizophila CBS 207.26 TaxID=1314779 RepID=A0A6A6DBA4_9PEZI|nr:cytochrome P450 [Zopfia rhizophila CBS 207.26]